MGVAEPKVPRTRAFLLCLVLTGLVDGARTGRLPYWEH
jgi:hypothetical protein